MCAFLSIQIDTKPFSTCCDCAADRARAAAAELKREQEQEVKHCRQEAKQRDKAKASATNIKSQPEPLSSPPAAPIHLIEEHVPDSGWLSNDSVSHLLAGYQESCQRTSAAA